jgi:PadR family transcriptional regulator AphA
VLGVLAEEPSHGFAVARRLAPGARIGSVWAMSRPHVYRAIRELAGRALIERAGTSPSERGPARELFAPTARGRAAIDAWLAEPVEHVRDVRRELLIKLALLFGRADATDSLLRAQRARLEPILDGLEREHEEAGGFEALVLRYRVETARAALVFVEQSLGALVPS